MSHFNDCFYPPNPPCPEPPAHNHSYGAPIQSYPIHDCACDGSGGEPREGAAWCAGAEPPRQECTPVPPPIPPVRYVPGMNVQDQLCNMAERVNISINRWNQIQAKCYEALDNVVGAAVNNDVYYTPDEVRFMEGYDDTSGCSYAMVEARACDRAGKPIFCHLRPAYNNETNSGARENITDVSFVTSAQMCMTAVQASETRWAGTTVFNCNPGASTPDDTVWVAGWTRNGVLRFFRGDVSQDVLRQNRMVNCIGPVFPVVKDGKEYEEVLASLGQEPGSIQAMGWKPNGNKVFFSCSSYDQPGMTPTAVAKVLQGCGCVTAVITSYQTTPVTAWDATPIAGTNSVVGEPADVISVPGMTGGMTFLGKLTTAPLQWSVPQNCAAWVITKKPCRGWRNAFTTEVANVVQRLGNQENSMNSILGQLKGENEAISKLEYQVNQNTTNISELKVTVGTFDSRITTVENRLNTVEGNLNGLTKRVTTIETTLNQHIAESNQKFAAVEQSISNERDERIAADNALRASLSAEVSARESADTILQNNINEEASIREAEDKKLYAAIDTEATARAQADRNLSAAIEAEASARSTKDTQHEAEMDAIRALIAKNESDVQEEIDSIKDGTGLPIATTTKLGAIKVGENLTIDEDGKLNAVGGGTGGDAIVQGPGIIVTKEPDGKKKISIDENVVVNSDELAAVTDRVDDLEGKVEEIQQKDQAQDEKIGQLEAADTVINQSITKIQQDIINQGDTLGEQITNVTNTVNEIKDGTGLPIASSTTLGAVKIGANLSISEDGVLSAAGGGEEPGGETVAAGTGIAVEHNTETNVATVSITTDVQNQLNSIATKADKTTVDALATTVAGKADKSAVEEVKSLAEDNADKIATNEAAIGEAETELAGLKQTVTNNTSEIGNLTTAVNNANNKNTEQDQEIAALKTKVDSIETGDTETSEKIAAIETEVETVKTGLDGKVSKSGDTMTGPLTSPRTIYGTSTGNLRVVSINSTNAAIAGVTAQTFNLANISVASPTDASHAARKSYVDEAVNGAVTTAGNALNTAQAADTKATEAKAAAENAMPKSGGKFTGPVTVTTTGIPADDEQAGLKFENSYSNHAPILLKSGDKALQLITSTGDSVALHGVAAPTAGDDAVNKDYVDTKYLPKTGGTINGNLTVSGSVNAQSHISTYGYSFASQGKKLYTLTNMIDGLPYIACKNEMGSQDITCRMAGATPIDDNDFATKAYVDKNAGGSSPWLSSVKYTAGDGISLNSRILAQTNGDWRIITLHGDGVLIGTNELWQLNVNTGIQLFNGDEIYSPVSYMISGSSAQMRAYIKTFGKTNFILYMQSLSGSVTFQSLTFRISGTLLFSID